jgi:hypothetical protein
MATISKTGIQDGLTSKAEHLTRIIDALDGTATTEVVATGSFTGSFIGDGSALTGVGGSSGIFLQTGSFYATTNNLQVTGSLVVTSNITASGNISSSFAANQTGATGVPSITGFEIAAHRYITRTQTITAAGTNQDSATSISAASAIVFVNGADNTKGVKLPDSTGIETGTTITIHNGVTNKTLEIYPAEGDQLLPNLSANNPATLPAAATFMCIRFSDGRWITFVCVGAT